MCIYSLPVFLPQTLPACQLCIRHHAENWGYKMKTTVTAFKALSFQWVSQSGYQTGAEGSEEVGQAGTRAYT